MPFDPQPCFIVDIDGTLADATHRQHFLEKEPKDWDGFFDAAADDPPYDYIVTLCQRLDEGYPVLLCTGRPERMRVVTMRWLNRHHVPYRKMYMRPNDDRSDDHLVKQVMLAKIREQGYAPILAVDDRPSVIKMWRENGVPCLAMDDTEWVKRQLLVGSKPL